MSTERQRSMLFCTTNPSALFMFSKPFEWFIDLFHFFFLSHSHSLSSLMCYVCQSFVSCVECKIRLIKMYPRPHQSSRPIFNIQCSRDRLFSILHFDLLHLFLFYSLHSNGIWLVLTINRCIFLFIDHYSLAMDRIWQTIESL